MFPTKTRSSTQRRLGSPFPSEGTCTSSEAFQAYLDMYAYESSIWDTLTFARGSLADPAVRTASEAASGLPAGSITWDAALESVAVKAPIFRHGRFNQTGVQQRTLQDVYQYGGRTGSIHHRDHPLGVKNQEGRGPWASMFLGSHMAVDIVGGGSISVGMADQADVQRGIITQESISDGLEHPNTHLVVGLVADLPGRMRSHDGSSDGSTATTQGGRSTLAWEDGTGPAALDMPLLVDLHYRNNDDDDDREDAAFGSFALPFGGKIKPAGADPLFVADGFNLIGNGAGAALAANLQPFVKIKFTLYPWMPSGPLLDNAPLLYRQFANRRGFAI